MKTKQPGTVTTGNASQRKTQLAALSVTECLLAPMNEYSLWNYARVSLQFAGKGKWSLQTVHLFDAGKFVDVLRVERTA
jgi:hypothetical protein